MYELIVDNFAGGGGTSVGIKLATGRSPDIAINHDPDAIAMHIANHPETFHYCEDIWSVDPVKATAGRPVALCWLSPDCTHHSKARGGKPVEKKIRGLAWVAVRWAKAVRPRVIILENVEEFRDWGPLTVENKPDPEHKGETFNRFVRALEKQGYVVDYRELKACDYGAPTIRKRFFLIARSDGRPIVWPEPTHGAGKIPYRTAAEIIDWSIPCPSIFATAEEIKAQYGIRAVRPLAEKTMARIAKGIRKFVLDNPEPFIIKFQQHSIGQPLDEPIHTVMAGATRFGLVAPASIPIAHYNGSNPTHSIDEPLRTVTAWPKGGHFAVVAPFLTQYHSYDGDGARGQTLDRPLLTQDASNRYGLVTSHLVKFKGDNVGQPVSEPIQTITAGGFHFGEVRAFLTHYYGTSVGSGLFDPLPTVVSRDRFGLVTVSGQDYQIADIGLRMLEPRELFRAQGFLEDYIIDRGADGKVLSKSSQVARCGNAVPPPFAEALVRANLPELCGMKELKVVEG